MRRDSPLPVIELTIERLSSKGNGLGIYTHPAGHEWTVEVPFAIPGDRVLATIIRKHAGIRHGRLEEVISPSKLRQSPRCLHFGACGGCRWQQAPYQEQLRWKEEGIRKAFESTAAAIFSPIVPCERHWEYRNKMEFSFSQNMAGERFLGLMLDTGRGRVLNITECHLVNRWFMSVLKAARDWWSASGLNAYHPYKDTGSLRTLTVREGTRTGDKLVMLTVSGNPDYALGKEQIDAFVAAVTAAVKADGPSGNLSIFLRIQQTCKGKETSFYEMHLSGPDHLREVLRVRHSTESETEPLTFRISPTAFFQPNTRQAEKFYSLALQAAGATKASVVYDLYCGTGTIGLSLAKHVKQVVGIEISPEAALDAKENAALNAIDNYSVLCGDMRTVLKQVFEEKAFPRPDILVIDPPRAGLDKPSLEFVLAFQAPTLVYISCNPKTQAANAAELTAAGYRLELVQPVDQFPHTVHVENIALFRTGANP